MPILHGIILRTRPAKSAHAYAQVWTDQGSPLAAITATQARALQARLGDGVQVGWGMRYGQPAIGAELERMKADGCDRILICPLYPQYSGATTASVMDALGQALAAMRWQPAIRTLPPYYDDPAHIAALVEDLSRQLRAMTFTPEVLLLSFHGMPERTLHLGDPYHCHCRKTARLVGEALAPLFPICAWKPRSRAALAGPNGWNPRPRPFWRRRQARARVLWPLPHRASPPIASRRWRNWPSGAGKCSRRWAERTLPCWNA
jgi:ferrochelatase